MLYDAYGDALFGIIVRIVKKREDAEEVLQSVFLKIWENIETYSESKSTIFTWMASIARNASIDCTRSRSSKASKVTDSFSVSDFGLEIKHYEKGIDINKLNAKLPEKYRVLIEKMYLEGYTQQEIAEIYEIPLGTVKTRLREAIGILRKELNDEKHLLYFLTSIL